MSDVTRVCRLADKPSGPGASLRWGSGRYHHDCWHVGRCCQPARRRFDRQTPRNDVRYHVHLSLGYSLSSNSTFLHKTTTR